MNSFRMKALAVAVLGLAGFGMAGSAFATCPTADTTKNVVHSPGGGGAWTSQFIANDASLAIVTPGLNGTACALEVSVGTISNSRAFVEDDSPNNEQRYRGRFYVSIASLPTFGGVTNQTGVVFVAQDATAPAAFSSNQLVVRLVGTPTVPQVRFFVGDANAASGVQQLIVPVADVATHAYRIEFDMQVGTTATSGQPCTTMPASGGCLRVWVNDAADASGSDTAPTASVTTNLTGWGGPDKVFLGLQTTTAPFRTAHHGAVIDLDEFDSRRQTFIGK